MTRLRAQLTYANVVASLALFLVLAGGTAYAATHLGKDSVGTAQIKDGAVTAAKIRKGSITDAQIRNGSLGGDELGKYFPGEGDEAGVAQVIYGTDADKGTRVYDDVLTIHGALGVREVRSYGSPTPPLGTVELVPPGGPQYRQWVVSSAGDNWRPVRIPTSRDSGTKVVLVESKGSTGTSFTARDPEDPRQAVWIKCSFEKINPAGVTQGNEMYCFAILSPAEAKAIEDEKGH